MDVSIGIALVLLMVTFIVIAIYYFRRQAVALEQVAEIEEERFMRQTKLWRKQDASQIKIGEPLSWFQKQTVIALGGDVHLLESGRKNSSPPMLEFLANGGQRVLFSPLDLRGMKKAFTGRKTEGKDAASRLKAIQDEIPLLGRNARGVQKGNVSLRDDEYFDIWAGSAGEKMGVNWGEPEKLWVYLVQA
jgi:hypothetical protein